MKASDALRTLVDELEQRLTVSTEYFIQACTRFCENEYAEESKRERRRFWNLTCEELDAVITIARRHLQAALEAEKGEAR